MFFFFWVILNINYVKYLQVLYNYSILKASETHDQVDIITLIMYKERS